MAIVRHFDGKKFVFANSTTTKRELEIYRRHYKDQGLNVRVVKRGLVYAIYTRRAIT
jgi:hypothetical protein